MGLRKPGEVEFRNLIGQEAIFSRKSRKMAFLIREQQCCGEGQGGRTHGNREACAHISVHDCKE